MGLAIIDEQHKFGVKQRAELAKKAVKEGIKKVFFDRGGYIYHGRVKAFAESARKEGLSF